LSQWAGIGSPKWPREISVVVRSDIVAVHTNGPAAKAV
jgi:hypothetical protein